MAHWHSPEKLLLAVDGNFHRDPQLNNIQGVRASLEHSPINEMYIVFLSFQASGICGEEEAEIVRAKRGG